MARFQAGDERKNKVGGQRAKSGIPDFILRQVVSNIDAT